MVHRVCISKQICCMPWVYISWVLRYVYQYVYRVCMPIYIFNMCVLLLSKARTLKLCMPCVVVLRCPWEAECVSWTRNPRAAASSELALSLALSQAPLYSDRWSEIKSESLQQSLHSRRHKTSMQAITHNTPKNYPKYAQHGRGMPFWDVPGMTKSNAMFTSTESQPRNRFHEKKNKKKRVV